LINLKLDPNSYNEYFNKKLIKWLLTMNINYGVQDELGRTALMYAVKYKDEYFAVEKMIHGKHINLLDKNGNSVLFHACEAYFTLEEFLSIEIYSMLIIWIIKMKIFSYLQQETKK